MPSAVRTAARAAIAASRSQKKTVTYSSFASVPTGTVDVACSQYAGAVGITSGYLRETGNTSGGNGYYYSAAVLPGAMGTDFFSVTATQATASSNNRGIGAGAFSADGTKGVFCTMCGNTQAAEILSWTGGVLTHQVSASGQYSTAANNLIKIVPSVSGGVVTWTVYLNGIAVPGLTWTDSAHLIDLPGKRMAACFRHAYSLGQYYSAGITAMSATDL